MKAFDDKASLEWFARAISDLPQFKGYQLWVEDAPTAPSGVDDNPLIEPAQDSPPPLNVLGLPGRDDGLCGKGRELPVGAQGACR